MTDLNESTVSNLLQAHGVRRWDVILLGDGSGSGADQPCGWSVVVIDRVTGTRKLLVGGQNLGSITLAELLPYLMALQYFDLSVRGAIHAPDPGRKNDILVHVFTDSQHTARAGQGVHSRSKYGALWAGFDHFKKLGYLIEWHWINEGRRNPFDLHTYVDEMASVGRSRMKDIEQSVEIYELLPGE